MNKTKKTIKSFKIYDIRKKLKEDYYKKDIKRGYKLWRSLDYSPSISLQKARKNSDERLEKAYKNLNKIDYNLLCHLYESIR
tara:strand:+ start:1085 stop:1330 length:246 start_codon:yes stop_codon:yes gene_type:complete